ncbi:MAG: hypothetical protein COT74_00910 [Bdellovibrionales bacterium CG10_big_fil_rev_8_21_14_0_10_45_34]|nr:MAG: hypothetical protein COT74_00910 [Bdellovibrionales bacterium CG10_big_fil_rev_8_21_14_0_10_45_34]
MFRWLDPSWLYGVWACLGLFVLYIIWSRRQKNQWLKHFSQQNLRYVRKGSDKAAHLSRVVLLLISLALLFVALARPQLGQGVESVKVQGVELIIGIDLSKSMLAEDLKPSRLALAKKQINRLLDNLGGDRVGLIGFAGSAVLLSPLTNDFSAIRMFLDSADEQTVSTQGTNFLAVLELAKKSFEDGGMEVTETQRVTRVVLLITDGEDHQSETMKKLEELGESGIRVFTVGVGTEEGAPIPDRDDRGYLRGYQKEAQQVVVSKANFESLRALAVKGGGSFFVATFNGTEINQLRQDLQALERAEFETEIVANYQELFQYPLILSFVCLSIFFLTIVNWRQFTRAGAAMVFLAIFGFSLSSERAMAQTSESLNPFEVYKNNQALKYSEEDEAEKLRSLEALESLAIANSNDAKLQFNYAVLLWVLKRPEAALKVLERISQLDASPELRFIQYFNAAAIATELKKIELALAYYQKALDLNPNSQEVKHNIELLLKSQSGSGGDSDQQKDQKDQDQSQNEQQQQDKKQGEQGEDEKDSDKEEAKDKKDQGQTGDQPPTPTPSPKDQGQQEPKEFKSEELTKKDVQNILDELKRQEEKIRNQLNQKPVKEPPNGKDW